MRIRTNNIIASIIGDKSAGNTNCFTYNSPLNISNNSDDTENSLENGEDSQPGCSYASQETLS